MCNRTARDTPARQQGAVLYVALIMLVLLALIGIVGMQVAGLQERMASNYRAINVAFQQAESQARNTEEDIRSRLNTGAAYLADREYCEADFDPLSWAEGLGGDDGHIITRRIDKCFAASSLRVGERLNEETGNIYEVTVLGNDGDSDTAATAVVNTVYIP